MFAYGVSLTDIHNVVRDVSSALYDGNITVRTGEDRSNRAGPPRHVHPPRHRHSGLRRQGKRIRVRQGHRPERQAPHHFRVLARPLRRAGRIVRQVPGRPRGYRDRHLHRAHVPGPCSGHRVQERRKPVVPGHCAGLLRVRPHRLRRHRRQVDGTGYVDDTDWMPSGDAMRPNTDVDYFLDQLDRVLAEQ